MNYLSQAVSQLQYLNSKEEFLVRDLFRGYIWKRIPLTDRLTLGTLFLNYIKNNPSLGITILNKTSSNQQKYQKQ